MQRAVLQTAIAPTIFKTFPRVAKSTSQFRQFKSAPIVMAAPSFADYKIENTSVPLAAGVQLNETQQALVGSVLDLFAGRPSLRKLSLWDDNATFVDPLTIAEGRKQYAAQWYGLKAAFSEIEQLDRQVVSGGNPIEVDLKSRYVVKGIGKEQTIQSRVKIFTEGEGAQMKIKRVEDRWNDSLPDGPFKNAMRSLNSVIVPTMVSVPKSIEEEEEKSGN